MTKFKVEIVKRNGKPVGVRAAQINGRIIYLALRDEPERMNWFSASYQAIPSIEEWFAISENFDAINDACEQAGGEPLKRDCYWSASEARHDYALYYDFNRISGLNFDEKPFRHNVRVIVNF
jgi:hypothetical protein